MFLKVKHILITAGLAFMVVYASFDYEDIYKNINTWYKVSTDELYPGEVVALDMSKGYSFCDEYVVYIIINTVETDEEVVMAFPNGGYWSSPGVDTLSTEIQKEFGKLEQDLRNK